MAELVFVTVFNTHSSCARLNWQLACQFFSANNISYRIVCVEKS